MASRRPGVATDHCFVWLQDADGKMLHGLSVERLEDARAMAGRAWLHFLRHRHGAKMLKGALGFTLAGDRQTGAVSWQQLEAWLQEPSVEQWEMTLKREIQVRFAGIR